jgi:hypothetical protein
MPHRVLERLCREGHFHAHLSQAASNSSAMIMGMPVWVPAEIGLPHPDSDRIVRGNLQEGVRLECACRGGRGRGGVEEFHMT